MSSGATWRLFVVLCLSICSSLGSGDRYIADEGYRYKAKFHNGSVCLTFSLEASIAVSYRYINYSNSSHPISVQEQEFTLPNKTETEMETSCSDDDDGLTRLLRLSWYQNDELFNITFNFTVNNTEWFLGQVLFDFELNGDNFQSPWPDNIGHQSYQTADHIRLFNRTFGLDQYFHCKSCKRVWLTSMQNDSETNSTEPGPCFHKDNKTVVCSFLELSHSVLYVGDLDNDDSVKKKLCVEDFIELQEIIIPSVVGGVLGVLLIIIFSAYLIAFLRRKKREGRYETLNDGY